MKRFVKRLGEALGVHIGIVALVFAVILAVLPLFVSSRYVLRLLILSLMNTMICLSLNLLVGYLGQMSMGHAAFWGAGAYTAAILATRYEAPTLVSAAAAILITGLLGLLLALPVMKLKGYYLTIVTLGFCEIIRLFELNAMEITRGALGIYHIPAMNFFGLTVKSSRGCYYIILLLVLLSAWIVHSFGKSRLGLAVAAIKQDELAAKSMGINVFACKLIVFCLSACLAGLAGVFYAQYQTLVMPTFTSAVSMQFVTQTIFGGLGNVAGSVLGSFSLTILPELMRGLDQYRNLLYGVIVVVMMLVKPNGILGSVNFKYMRQRYEFRRAQSREGDTHRG